MNIPIVDFGGKLTGHSQAEMQKIAVSMHQALNQVGFAYVQNCGIDWPMTQNLMSLARKYFQQPSATKMQIAMEHAGLAWRGYFPLGEELTAAAPDQKEGLYFGIDYPENSSAVKSRLPMHGLNQWPDEEDFAGMPSLVTTYINDLTRLGHVMMESLAIGLGINQDYFSQRFGQDPTVLFRIFNYPAQGAEAEGWGVGEHTDMGFLTMLLQDDLGGLQIKTDDGWIDAPPIPNSFVINIGDMLQHWSHGIYRATLHRVKNVSNKGRISLPLFFDPSWLAKLEPIDPELLDSKLLESAQARPNYRRWDGLDIQALNPDLTYGEFVWDKIKDVFPKLR